MNTEDMIRMMAADEMLEPPVESALPRGLAVGGLASVALFLVVLGPRPDLGEAFARSAVLLKPILGLALAGTATFAVLRAARPGADPSHRLHMLWLAPTLAALAIAGALWSLPPDYGRRQSPDSPAACSTAFSACRSCLCLSSPPRFTHSGREPACGLG